MEGHLNRRRSLFEFEIEKSEIKSNEPNSKCESKYPEEYVQKLKTELEQWEQYVKNIPNERKEYKKEMKELRRRVYDERILSPEQSDFLQSVNFTNYIRRGSKFLTKICIISEKNKEFDEVIDHRLKVVKNKIAEDIFKIN